LTAKFDIVVACELDRGIGLHNHLPWRLSNDLKYFRDLTRGKEGGVQNCVIMGRNTWESIPEKHRPLPGRLNIVLSRNAGSLKTAFRAANVEFADSLDEALWMSSRASGDGRTFVIGGAKVYEQAIHHANCDRLYLTQIIANFECDVFFPSFEEKFSLLSETEVQEENDIPYSFKIFQHRS
jgi:dihydrofolate reductase